MPSIEGESGNPGWAAARSHNTKMLLCEAMLDAESEEFARQPINLAHAGDSGAPRPVRRPGAAARGQPARRLRPAAVDDGESARRAISDVIAATGRGELASREANELLRVIERGARIIGVLEAADAAVRVNPPRHVRVTWVEPEERRAKWKA